MGPLRIRISDNENNFQKTSKKLHKILLPFPTNKRKRRETVFSGRESGISLNPRESKRIQENLLISIQENLLISIQENLLISIRENLLISISTTSQQARRIVHWTGSGSVWIQIHLTVRTDQWFVQKLS